MFCVCVRYCVQLDSIDRVIFSVFLNIDMNLYQSWMQVYFPSCADTTSDDTDSATDARCSLFW